MRGKNLFFFVLGAGVVASGLWGLSVGALTGFTSGTPIKASEVNSNFGILRTAIEALEQPIGVSRLSIGGTLGDGKVIKAQGGNLVWGDDLAGGSTFGSTLSGNAASPGFSVTNNNDSNNSVGLLGEVPAQGTGVRGIAGGRGNGVYGEARGVLGVGVLGIISNTGWGVRGVTNGVGIGVEGESLGGGAGVSAKSTSGTALLIDGTIAVRGNRAAFVHLSTAGNIESSRTTIDSPMTNGDATVMLFVTHVSSGSDPIIDAPIGVSYGAAVGRWRIFRADGGVMPPDAKFNVMVIKQL